MTYKERKAQAAYQQHLWRRGTTLADYYKRPSSAKLRAQADILWEMGRNNGFGFGIISYNTNIFTCGYEYVDDASGELLFVYHTPSYCVVIPSPGN